MSPPQIRRVRAVADVAEGQVLASVETASSQERVFRALSSKRISDWWVRPGAFVTTDWAGEVQVGGHWRASGLANGQVYIVGGTFLEVVRPRRLVHTWHLVGATTAPTTLTQLVDRIEGGTRVILRHFGFASPEACRNSCLGWKTSLTRLAEIMEDQITPSPSIPA